MKQANLLVEKGLNVGGTIEEVLLLSQPATKVTLSNVPPFGGSVWVQITAAEARTLPLKTGLPDPQ